MLPEASSPSQPVPMWLLVHFVVLQTHRLNLKTASVHVDSLPVKSLLNVAIQEEENPRRAGRIRRDLIPAAAASDSAATDINAP